jgi:hypothetical protein
MGVLPTLSIFGWGILFGWIAAKGFNPKAAVQRQRDLELGQWLRKRATGALDKLRFAPDCEVRARSIFIMEDKRRVELTIRAARHLEPIEEQA